jgi:alpha-glucosidase
MLLNQLSTQMKDIDKEINNIPDQIAAKEELNELNKLESNDIFSDANTEEEDLEQTIVNALVEVSPITKQYLKAVEKCKVVGNCYYFSDDVATVEVKVVSDEIIRVKLAPHGTFLAEFSYGVETTEFRTSRIDYTEDAEYYKVSTNTVTCMINKTNFCISFADRDELIINEDAESMHWEENADFGGYYVYSAKKLQAEENFFGLGDKATELNLKGKRFELWGTDTYGFEKNRDPLYRNIPFYIGIHHGIAYGLFYDNTFKAYFDFGAENGEKASFWADGGELQYYYIHGPHMMDVVKRYASLTGTHPMPAMWALGYHQCRWSYYPEKRVKEIAATFRQKQIPCDALYLDIDYMDGYRCFTWNKKYFPNPKRMIRELHDDGFKLVVIIDPGIKVDENYWVYKEGAENEYFCRRADDYLMEGHVWPGRCQFPDFTNPKVREWWGGLFKEYVEIGVAGVWNDMNEPAVFGTGTFPNDVRHHYDGHRGSHRKAHNVYGMQMVRATYEGLKKLQKNKRPFTITRSGYAGTQRYSSVWTGDNVASWEHLKLAVIMCQRLCTSGISFCGSDIGGFTGEPDGELFARWIQFGVFSPLMRTHSAGDTRSREPWSFGPEIEAVVKKFIELRYKILPYLYSAFWEHHKYNFPILRPVSMIEQGIVSNHFREDEFTLSDKILVCPILEAGSVGRKVYMPVGLWYNYWDNTTYYGGQEHYIDAPLHSIPMFIKAGAVIPEYPVMQFTQEYDLEELKLNVYFADYNVISFIYEDHGDTFGYEQDIYLEKKFSLTGTSNSINIQQSKEGLYTPLYELYNMNVIGIPFTINKIIADGKEIEDFHHDTHTEILKFKVSKNFKKLEIA